MAYPVKAVANYLLALAKDKGEKLSPMKLQKLVYFAHGWHLAFTGQSLIDEKVEAWQYGPVIPSLYHEFSNYGAGNISKLATELDDDFEFITPKLPNDDAADKFAKALLEKVFEVYGKHSGIQLSNLTHLPDTPWSQTWKAGLPKGTDISDELITDHFKQKLGK